MKGDPQVIKNLNTVLKNELTAINQYFLHARICKDWGYENIAKKIYEESIEEMRHAQELTDRILFLDALPNLQSLNPLGIGENMSEIFESDLKLELNSHKDLKNFIPHAYDTADHGSREIFEKILREEEEHIDWLEAQIKIVSDVGLQNYLAEQI